MILSYIFLFSIIPYSYAFLTPYLIIKAVEVINDMAPMIPLANNIVSHVHHEINSLKMKGCDSVDGVCRFQFIYDAESILTNINNISYIITEQTLKISDELNDELNLLTKVNCSENVDSVKCGYKFIRDIESTISNINNITSITHNILEHRVNKLITDISEIITVEIQYIYSIQPILEGLLGLYVVICITLELLLILGIIKLCLIIKK